MKKSEFERLFVRCVGDAIAQARHLTDKGLPSEFQIELHGGGVSGRIVSVEEAINRMYMGEHNFSRVIDIGLKEVRRGASVIFVRVSPQYVTSIEATWNSPKGNGPFKIIEPVKIAFFD